MLDPLNDAFRLTYLILGLVVFARQACLPVPAVLFLLAAGALARGGEINVTFVLGVGILGCLAGDMVWFEAGRRWGNQILRILCVFSNDPHYCAQRAHKSFARWGLRALIVAKFIPGLDAATPPLAGAEGSKRSAFLAYDFCGSLLWSGLYTGLGYLFANRIAAIAASMARFGDVLAALIGIPLACYAGWRVWIIVHMLRHLKLRRITPALLHEKIMLGEQFAIIDLLSFEEEPENSVGIPGAVRMDPARLRSRSKVVVPEHLGIILYCSSSGELTSARVAVALQKKGISNVWILEGGLNAWKKEGFSVTSHLLTSSEAAERFGIKTIVHD
jgi:membrane protein DedA with SNARE-associated domain/rhodanese-related sulfurtransferase